MLVFVQEWLTVQSTEAPSCTIMALSPEETEQLCGSSQLSEMFARGGTVGQPLHMQSWGLEGMGPSCMEQLMVVGDASGHELAKGEPETSKVVRLVRPSNTPTGRLVRPSLPLKSRRVRLVRPSNTPTGRLARSLSDKHRYVRLVRLPNTPTGRLARSLSDKYRCVRLLRFSNALTLMLVMPLDLKLKLMPPQLLQSCRTLLSTPQHAGTAPVTSAHRLNRHTTIMILHHLASLIDVLIFPAVMPARHAVPSFGVVSNVDCTPRISELPRA